MFRPAAPTHSENKVPYRSSLGSSSHSGIFRNDIPSMQVNRRGWLGQVYTGAAAPPPKVAAKIGSAVETPKLSSRMPPPSFRTPPQDSNASPMRSMTKPVVPMQSTSGFLGNLLFETPKEKNCHFKRSCSLPRKEAYTSASDDHRRPLTYRASAAYEVPPPRRDLQMRQSQSLLPPTLSDRVLELTRTDQPNHPALCSSSSSEYLWNNTSTSGAAAAAKSAKDECEEDETSKVINAVMAKAKDVMAKAKDECEEDETLNEVLMLGKSAQCVRSAQDVQSSSCAERSTSPSKRLSCTLHNEMRGSDLRYLDVKELAQDLEPSNWPQAGTRRASAQCKDFELDLKFNMDLRQSQSPSMSSRQAQDQRVQTARTYAAHARGLGNALDGDLRGLQQEFADLARDLENVRAGLRLHTPRQ